MKLTDAQCRAAKPTGNLQKLSDGGGLQLWLQPNGAKLWRLAYRFGGKQRLLALGSYPLITLASARLARDAAKRKLIDRIDPAEVRKEQRARQAAAGQTFGLVADELFAKLKTEGRAPKTLHKTKWLLDLARPTIGDRPITAVKPAEVLVVLRKVEQRGRYASAHRLRSTISAVFRLAIATDRAEADPTLVLRDALMSYKEEPRPALTAPKQFGALLRAIAHYDGQPVTRIGLQLLAIMFPRPGELRQAYWPEFDFNAATWSVPAERMKGRRPHFVPLSRQAIALLRELQALTGGSGLAFPGIGNPRRCLSDATFNSALRRMGYDTAVEHCAHGFRSSASTMLNELGRFSPDAIERQLSHVDENEIRRIYARGKYWNERVELMQVWADHCDWVRAAPSDFGRLVTTA